MFHIELRQPPHRLHRFNLSEQALRSEVLEPWVRGRSFEVGERSWSPEATTMIVLEGPEIPVGSLTMARGWSVAQREGRDVTERALGSVREALMASASSAVEPAPGGSAAPAPIGNQLAPADLDLLADALGLELLRGLGETPMSLPAAWRTAAQRHPQASAAATLELAQRAVASLARARLITLSSAGDPGAPQLEGAELDEALAAIDSWTAESGARALWIRRV